MKERIADVLQKLDQRRSLTAEEWKLLLTDAAEQDRETAAELARKRAREQFGRKIYTRGLIEISNYCRNNCFYCGIRRENGDVSRYRLGKEEILDCARQGYDLGFRTFVLQGGEDGYYTDERLCGIVEGLKTEYPDCAVTLSVGERSRASYERLFAAGANRYLLRHETADEEHYRSLHPGEMSFSNRMRCLRDLKEIGYQVGCGFMVGSPGQRTEHLVKDLLFLQEFRPHMVGIGPFVPHHGTPFAKEAQGTVEQTLYLLSLIRLMMPEVLLPSTTALGTIDPMGREKGILAGANVLMPNLSPGAVRKKYELYDNKICTGDEAAESRRLLAQRMEKIGYELGKERGDAPGYARPVRREADS